MPHLDLSDDETIALATLLTRKIGADGHPRSPRIRTLTAIRDKVRPAELDREPPPPPQV